MTARYALGWLLGFPLGVLCGLLLALAIVCWKGARWMAYRLQLGAELERAAADAEAAAASRPRPSKLAAFQIGRPVVMPSRMGRRFKVKVRHH